MTDAERWARIEQLRREGALPSPTRKFASDAQRRLRLQEIVNGAEGAATFVERARYATIRALWGDTQ